MVRSKSLWKKAIESGRDEDWIFFRVFRNNLRHQLNRAKKDYSNNRLQTDDPKKSWSVIRELSGLEPKRTDKIVLKKEEEIIEKSVEVANTMNQYFVNKVEKIVEDHPPDPVLASAYTERYLKGRKLGNMTFKPVEERIIKEIIRQLKSTGAVGTDGISVILIKKVSEILVPYITYIVNLAIVTSKYPEAFKVGVISPVPKSGDLAEVSNWRPVVILNSTSKCLERVLNSQRNILRSTNC